MSSMARRMISFFAHHLFNLPGIQKHYSPSDGGKVVLDYEGEKIGYSIYEEQPHVTVMDRKRLDAFLDRKVPMSIIQRHRKGDRVNF